MKWLIGLLSAAILVGVGGCSRPAPSSDAKGKSAKAQAEQKTSTPRAPIAEEEICDRNGTLKYKVRRLSGSSGSQSWISVHEVDFYAPDGQTKVKTQNYYLGVPTMHKIAEVRYFSPDGKLKETWHLRFDGTTESIDFHDPATGKVVKTEKHDPADLPPEEPPPGIFEK